MRGILKQVTFKMQQIWLSQCKRSLPKLIFQILRENLYPPLS